MASISEIEKLERRCAENPHGLTFAPLAEAYRKHGDLDRALEVLRAGRELHPDYIPASIVLGRCHLDRAELPEAERAFAHVLTLDPENVIALKALAELAEREGRLVQAERWLNLLLAVDSTNEDARTQLERLGSRPAAEPQPEAADAAPAEEPAGPQGQDEGVVAEEPAPVHATMSAADPAALERAPVPPSADDDPATFDAGDRDTLDAGEPADLDPVADAGETGPDLLDLAVEREEEIVLTPADTSDYHDETRSPLPELSPGEPHDEAERPHYLFTEPDSAEPDAAERDAADPAADGLEPVPDLMSELAGPAVQNTVYPTAVPQPAPVVTESMAELYLRQGHRADALAIYRQLAERRPDDRHLASVVADLSAEVDAAPARAPAYAAIETGGRSVAELLRGILAERLPAAAPTPERFSSGDAPAAEFRGRDEVLSDADDQGEPTRPAGDHLTLGAVFGEEAAAPPPAVADPESAPPEPGHGLSFDEFFGAPPTAEPDATRTQRPAPADQPDDLDQFHAWLQSLKR